MQKKLVVYLILLCLGAVSLAAGQAAQSWVKYTPPSGKFTVLFPADPKPDHQTLNDGGLITEVDTYLSSEKGIFFLVNYMALNPKAALSADSALKTAQDGLLQTGGAKLLTSSRTEFVRGPNDRLPMLEFTGETNSVAVRGSAILDVDHIYTVATLCPKRLDCSVSVPKFFTSFKLNPATQPANDTWVKFTSSEGNFSALFPVPPQPDHKTTHTEGQTIETTSFIVQDHDIMVGANYTDYDPNTIYPVEEGMKAEQDSLVKLFHATLLTSTRTEFPRGANEKLPSLEFTASSNDRILKGIVIVDVRRVYIVVSLCPSTADGSAVSAKFFGSFRLTPKD